MYDTYDNPELDYELDNPGEVILAENSNPLASEAMSLASQYRAEGCSPSEALRKGWRDVKGEGNPEFVPSLLTLALVGAGIFVAVWKWKKGTWPWQALELGKAKQQAIAQAQRLAMLRRRQQQQGQQWHGSIIPVYRGRTPQEETITLLVP